ncbi:MAG: inorganic phosphate transporter [Planctomycetota bacterium]
MYAISGGVLLGWSLGANDAANVFGTAVASRIVRYRTAVFLTAAFVIVGAVAQGTSGIETLSGLVTQSKKSALVVTLAAAATVAWMTYLRLPVSTSQAAVGAIIGVGLVRGTQAVRWSGLAKIIICWVGTPLGAAVIAFLLYPMLGWCLNRLRLKIVARSVVLKLGLIIFGTYGAYALGANNVGNVSGVFRDTGVLGGDTRLLQLVGGASIALGVLTYSRGVMFTVGSRLVPLDAFSALVAVAAQAITVHIYAFIGVPVSTSQAIVGGVLGIGVLKGVRTVNTRMLLRILSGWVATPAAA